MLPASGQMRIVRELFAERVAPCLGAADMFVEIDDEQRQDRLPSHGAISVAETRPVARRYRALQVWSRCPRLRMIAQHPNKEDPMSFYENGDIRIHYEEAGSGFPLLVIPGGGLNSTTAGLATHPFNPFDEFKGEFRVISADLRNARGGESSGPLEVDRPWDAYTDDHIGLMDHLRIRRFMVLGFCIGGPFIWNLVKRVPDRLVAAVPAQPSGYRPEMPGMSYDNNMKGWGPELCARRPDITMAMVDTFLTNMYTGARADFVYSVTRDVVRNCQTPILVLPDDVPAHPYAVAMETVHLAPNAQVSLYPWKDTPDKIPLAVRHIRTFLRANRPAAAGQSVAAAAQ
jgi:pimeloyl-ACP methyl ester carboxylesterase